MAVVPTGKTHNLADVLSRWQSEAGTEFPESVWQEYTVPTARNTTLYQCLRCGFSMFAPTVVGNSAFYTAITAGQYYVEEKWEFIQGAKDIASLQAARILDIGCGSGYFLDLLKTKGMKCSGYEFSPEASEAARAKGHDIFNGPFPEALASTAPYDVICMFQVLEHLPDPIGFLRDARKLLRPEGVLIVSVPDANGPIRHFPDALTELPPHHVSRWCELTFRIGMPLLGFRVEKALYEPLPDYLWHTYLPVMWDSGIWPAEICRAANGLEDMGINDSVLWFIGEMRKYGAKLLYGVPSHTLYVVLKRDEKPTRSTISEFRTDADAKFENLSSAELLRLYKELLSYNRQYREKSDEECREEEMRMGRYRLEIGQRESYLVSQQKILIRQQDEFARRKEGLAERETTLAARENEFVKREEAISAKENKLVERAEGLTVRENELAGRAENLSIKEQRYEKLFIVRVARELKALFKT
ncbi:MAG: methyltransferase domain-containing protein [Nitrospirae bacterium]|nr:methyltransferase domain-containing protein [Nitrospirota bacterium]